MQTDLKSSLARDHILAWIREENLPVGSKLPSERHIAGIMEMDQRTVRRGIDDLVRVLTVAGRGRESEEGESEEA